MSARLKRSDHPGTLDAPPTVPSMTTPGVPTPTAPGRGWRSPLRRTVPDAGLDDVDDPQVVASRRGAKLHASPRLLACRLSPPCARWCRPGRRPPSAFAVIDGKDVTTGDTFELRAPHDHACTSATSTPRAPTRSRGDRRRTGRQARLGSHGLARPRRDLPARRRPARRAVARHDQRRDDAAPVQDVQQAEIDAACELIDFLRFNVPPTPAAAREQPADQPARRVEPARPTGRSRASSWPSRRSTSPPSPATCRPPRRCRQHGRVEAVGEAGPRRPLHDAPAAGGGAARRGHQPRPRRRGARGREVAMEPRTSPGCTSPAPIRCSARCGARSASASTATAASPASSASPAARTSCSPTRPPTSTAGRRAGPGCLRVPGPEVLRGVPRLRPRACGRRSATELIDHAGLTMGDVADFSQLHGRGHRRARVPTGRRRPGAARNDPDARCWSAAADDRRGWFVEPTIVRHLRPAARDHGDRAVRPDPDRVRLRRRRLGARARPGRHDLAVRADRAVFADDRVAVDQAAHRLRNAAGNFYVNDKPTGSIVGQQPFGGARDVGHQRQGGLAPEPAALDEPAVDQGDLGPADRPHATPTWAMPPKRSRNACPTWSGSSTTRRTRRPPRRG
jgi:1-pyrroline-5-carboxylate dehydrogenase